MMLTSNRILSDMTDTIRIRIQKYENKYNISHIRRYLIHFHHSSQARVNPFPKSQIKGNCL